MEINSEPIKELIRLMKAPTYNSQEFVEGFEIFSHKQYYPLSVRLMNYYLLVFVY